MALGPVSSVPFTGRLHNTGAVLLCEAKDLLTNKIDTKIAAQRSHFRMDRRWDSDVILISDGSALIDELSDARGLLTGLARSLDFIYMTSSTRGLACRDNSRPLFISAQMYGRPMGWDVFHSGPNTLKVAANAIYNIPTWDVLGTLRLFRAFGRTEATRKRAASALQALLEQDRAVATLDVCARAVFINTPTEPLHHRYVRRIESLQRQLGRDIRRDLAHFRRASTLSDSYSPDTIDAIVRLGTYTAALRWGDISEALDKAAFGSAKFDSARAVERFNRRCRKSQGLGAN